MFRCVAYNEALQEEWDKLALSKGTIFHTTAFRRVLLKTFGYECAYQAVVDEKGCIKALLPLVAGRNLGLRKVGVALPFINYLDVCAANEEARQFAFASIPAIKDRLELAYVELRLKEQELEHPGWTSNRQNFTFVLPLAGDEEQVLAQSSASNRNHVRKVYRNNWFHVSFEQEYLDAFYRVYVKRMKQLGSPAPSIRFFKQFFECMPDHTFLLTVLDAQTSRVAGGMLLISSPSNGTLYYPYGANLLEYNSKYLNNFMYWEAAKLGMRLGLQQLDLGRSQAGSGTYRYKEQWGATARQLRYLVCAPDCEKAGPVDRDKLSFYIELWKKMPQWITDTVGKRLIRYLLP